MKDFRLDIDVATVDPDGICDGNSSAITQLLIDGNLSASFDLDGIANGNSSAGASVTIDDAALDCVGGVYTDRTGIPRHIYFLDAGGHDQTGATYTLIGRQTNGDILTETLTGPNSGLFVISALRYHSLSSIAIASPKAASTLDVGTMGHFTSADGLAHRMNIIASAHDQSAKTYTFTGTDADGKAQSEDLTGPGTSATVETLKYFLTVSNIVVSAGTASSSVDIGTVDEIASKTIPLDWYATEAAVVQLDITGVVSVDVQITLQNPFQNDTAPFDFDDQEDLAWVNDTNFTAETADILLPLQNKGVKAMRVVTNSYSTGAEAQVYVSQPRTYV